MIYSARLIIVYRKMDQLSQKTRYLTNVLFYYPSDVYKGVMFYVLLNDRHGSYRCYSPPTLSSDITSLKWSTYFISLQPRTIRNSSNHSLVAQLDKKIAQQIK